MATLVGGVFDDFGDLGEGDCDPVAAIGAAVSFVNEQGPGAGPFTGTTGNDLYFITDSSTRILEHPKGGTDLVVSWVSYTLDNNVEHLLLTGSDNIDGTGNNGKNVLAGNDGNNALSGEADDDFLVGGGGNDLLEGGSGDDHLCAGTGDDTALGGSGHDEILGGEGNDSINGESGNDTIDAGADNDTVFGGSGKDSMDGGAGDDTMDGDAGNDTIIGGYGNDYLVGDAGNDVFVYGDNSGFDTIADFEIGHDVIQIAAHINGGDIASAGDVLSHVANDGNNDAVIDLGNGNGVVLIGIDENDVTSGFFHIV